MIHQPDIPNGMLKISSVNHTTSMEDRMVAFIDQGGLCLKPSHRGEFTVMIYCLETS